MNYLVHDFSKHGKVFATLQEANAYRNDCMRQTGYVFLVTETSRKITHTFNIDSKISNPIF